MHMARGTTCWRQPDGRRLCGDAPGIATPTTPLSVSPGAVIRIEGDFANVNQASGSIRSIGDTPVIDDPEGLVWEPGAVAQSFSGLAVTVRAPPGRYALNVTLTFPEGSASYGVVLFIGS